MRAKVPVRFIELKDSPPSFETDVTKNTNTQNRIDKRDFVSLDPQQERIREELALHDIAYVFKSGELPLRMDESFDINEATVARACMHNSIDYAVLSKREIGKLWDDIEKPPYKTLFNPAVVSLELWRAVLVLRIVEERLSELQKKLIDSRLKLYATHGNRFLTHLVYRQVPGILSEQEKQLSIVEKENVQEVVETAFLQLIAATEQEYPDAYLASLFKNGSKCKEIYAKHFAKTQ